MRALAAHERLALRDKATELESALLLELVPRDEDDDKGVIIEVRPGVGGDEAALFSGELLDMYRAYAGLRGWPFQLLSAVPTDAGGGGVRNAIASVSVAGAFGALRRESGVHRVQRVPLTESQGRVHTSTALVVILPEADEVDTVVRDQDVRVDTYRAGGAGGQHVNTTDSAVRVTHIPTGISATCQNERSQLRNKDIAMKVLRARLYERERSARQAAESADRRASGSGERNERLRTYNFQQGRVTDHRVGLSEHGVEAMMRGERLDVFIDALQRKEQEDLVAHMLA